MRPWSVSLALLPLLLLVLAGCAQPPEPTTQDGGGSDPRGASPTDTPTPGPTTPAPTQPTDPDPPEPPEGFTWDGFLATRVCIPEGVGQCEAFFGPRRDEEDGMRKQPGWQPNASAELRMTIDWEPQGPQQEVLRAYMDASGPCASPHEDRCSLRSLFYDEVRPGDELTVPVTLRANETTLWYFVTWDFPGNEPVRAFAYLDQDFTLTVETREA